MRHKQTMWFTRVCISLVTFSVIACSPALQAKEADKASCLKSVEPYMEKTEAERFCSQPPECRKWWDDLSAEEQEQLQPPTKNRDPDWWVRCEMSNPGKGGRHD